MRISPERLIAEAEATGFQPELLEKTFHLLGLLDAVNSHTFLREKTRSEGRNRTEPVRVRRAETVSGHRSELRRL